MTISVWHFLASKASEDELSLSFSTRSNLIQIVFWAAFILLLLVVQWTINLMGERFRFSQFLYVRATIVRVVWGVGLRGVQ